MPPRKDPNADKSGGSSSSAGNNNTAPNSSTTTTNTATTTATTTANASASTATLPTTTTASTTSASVPVVIPPASITNTRATSTALAAAAAACVLSGTNSAGGEVTTAGTADTATEQRTMAFQANAKLCRLVRKCPWMYDRNHHNYAKKHILDKSWVKIARDCNDTVPSCKERWRNIRAAFARSINIYKTHSGPNRVKPYYLHKELSFLVKPMMEGRDKNDDIQDNSEGGIKGEDEDEEHDVAEEPPTTEDDDDFNDEAADIKSTFEAPNTEIGNQSTAKFNKMLKNLNNALINSSRNQNFNSDFEGSLANRYDPQADFSVSDGENEFHFPDDSLCQEDLERKSVNMLNHNSAVKRPMHVEAETYETKRLKLSQIAPSAAEPDIRFLEALLPDMALMNTKQKIIFKRKIYQTLEEVFESSNDFPNLNSTNEPPTNNNNKNNNMSQTMITTITSNPNQNAALSNNVMNNLGNNQVKQTVLTVNSSIARNLINNIASLSEADLQRVHGFLQSNVRTTSNNNSMMNTNTNHMNNLNQNSTQRMINGGPMPPSATAARLIHSTPKITITKVTCPPPASLRNIATNKPPSPTTATVSTTIHHTPGPIMTPNVHSTTSTMTAIPSIASNNNTGTNANAYPLSQLMPIAIKDEIEDVDID